MSIGTASWSSGSSSPPASRMAQAARPLLPGGEGRPARLVGTVADASKLRPGVNDVARVQRLAAALAAAGTVRDVSQAVVAALRKPLRADRVALAELEGDRLVVTVLDPPGAGGLARGVALRVALRVARRAGARHAHPRRRPARGPRRASGPPGTDLEPASRRRRPRRPRRPAAARRGPHGRGLPDRLGQPRTIRPRRARPADRHRGARRAGADARPRLRRRTRTRRHAPAHLLPRRLPELPGAVAVARYLPTTAGLEVGGDWYDVIPLPDNHVALVIGDVQGHSAGAATLMGQMRTAVRAYAVEGHPPDVVVSHANRLLVGHGDRPLRHLLLCRRGHGGGHRLVRTGRTPPAGAASPGRRHRDR